MEIPEDYKEVSLKILDASGKILISESNLQPGVNNISIKEFSKGLYYVYLTLNDKSLMHKVIK